MNKLGMHSTAPCPRRSQIAPTKRDCPTIVTGSRPAAKAAGAAGSCSSVSQMWVRHLVSQRRLLNLKTTRSATAAAATLKTASSQSGMSRFYAGSRAEGRLFGCWERRYNQPSSSPAPMSPKAVLRPRRPALSERRRTMRRRSAGTRDPDRGRMWQRQSDDAFRPVDELFRDERDQRDRQPRGARRRGRHLSAAGGGRGPRRPHVARVSQRRARRDERQPADARARPDRHGPWYNVNGALVANNVAELHARTRRRRAVRRRTRPADQRAMDRVAESRAARHPDRIERGRHAVAGWTCADWTSDSATIAAQVGHSDGMGPNRAPRRAEQLVELGAREPELRRHGAARWRGTVLLLRAIARASGAVSYDMKGMELVKPMKKTVQGGGLSSLLCLEKALPPGRSSTS